MCAAAILLQAILVIVLLSGNQPCEAELVHGCHMRAGRLRCVDFLGYQCIPRARLVAFFDPVVRVCYRGRIALGVEVASGIDFSLTHSGYGS
jgi:hypothetical protein